MKPGPDARFLVVSDSDDVAPMLGERYGAQRVLSLSAQHVASRQLAYASRHHGRSHRHAAAGADAALVRELLEHVQRGRVVARRHDGARERFLKPRARQPARAVFELSRYQS